METEPGTNIETDEELASETFRLLETVFQGSLEASAALRFDGSHALHVTCVCLYGTILELTENVIHIIQRAEFTTGKIVLRSIFEAVIALENLVKDPKFGYSLDAESYSESVKFLNALMKDGNPAAQGVDRNRLEENLLKVKELREIAIQKGGKEVSLYDRCRNIGAEHEYGTLYRHLCGETHHNHGHLLNRHIERDGENFRFVYFREARSDELEVLSGISASLLMRATKSIHALLNHPARALVSELDKIFSKSYAERESLERTREMRRAAT